ncbi:unnamed protein product, partial [Brassica oleracea]
AEIFAGEKRNAECFAESRRRQTTASNFVTHSFTGELQQAISEISSFPFSYILIITNSTPESFHRNHHEISSAENSQRTLLNKTAVDYERSDDADLKAGRSP